MERATAPAGWYNDPSGGAQDRWWDGAQWQDAWRPPAPPPPSTVNPPAGWYPDGNSTNRYWDGRQWTEQITSGPHLRAARPAAFWWAVAAAALIIVGGVGPWATALGVVDVSGTHGDGWIVIAAGAISAAALLVARGNGGAIVGLLAALVATGTGAFDLNHIQSRGALVEAAWGIYAVIAGGVILGIASLALLARRS